VVSQEGYETLTERDQYDRELTEQIKTALLLSVRSSAQKERFSENAVEQDNGHLG
jgi:hypothetical protein